MRIAVSGTHHVGKTTLIEAFVRARPEYDFEPEPYHAQADAGVAFADPPTEEDFLEQLAYSIRRLDERAKDPSVIFDRGPLDFVAYLQAMTARLVGRFDFEDFRDEVAGAMAALDLIVFIPAKDKAFDGEDIAYPRLRRAVDRRLRAILLEDELALVEGGRPIIVELSGSTEARLEGLTRLVGRRALA